MVGQVEKNGMPKTHTKDLIAMDTEQKIKFAKPAKQICLAEESLTHSSRIANTDWCNWQTKFGENSTILQTLVPPNFHYLR